MAQLKIYGLDTSIRPIQLKLSTAIHEALVDALQLPEDKRFQRFILLRDEDFIYPADRTERYIIIEISMFEGRSTEVKKRLIHLLYSGISKLGIQANDLEITIIETPRSNWGIRGVPADELALNYNVNL